MKAVLEEQKAYHAEPRRRFGDETSKDGITCNQLIKDCTEHGKGCIDAAVMCSVAATFAKDEIQRRRHTAAAHAAAHAASSKAESSKKR